MKSKQWGKITNFTLSIIIAAFTLRYFHNFIEKSEDGLAWKTSFRPRHVLPHCIIIGEAKCGTYALKKMLSEFYPNIRAKENESHYFSRGYSHRTIEQYKKTLPLMQDPDDIVMEGTPNYFRFPEVAERIFKAVPNAKFILILCDPIKHTISWSLTNAIPLPDNMTIDQYLIDKTGELKNTHSQLIQMSLYAMQISRWFRIFSREQILILDGQQLISDPVS